MGSNRGFWRTRRRLVLVALAAVVVGIVAFGSLMAMPTLKPGDRAPDFNVTAHNGQPVSLAALRGKPAVVYFYPKDNTTVCTKEACAFRDTFEDFVKAGATVIGISADSDESHRQFAAERHLPFLLVSDADGSLRKAFGVPKTFGLIPGRVTYVIDGDGVVRHVFNSQFSADRHTTEALQVVQQLAGSQP